MHDPNGKSLLQYLAEFVPTISAREITLRLIKVLVVLVVTDILGIISRYAFGHGNLYGLIALFDFWGESNIPTIYNMSLLALNAFLFLVLSDVFRQAGNKATFWVFASGVFCFLAIDEVVAIHEKVNVALSGLHLTGAFYFAWIIPYSIAAVAFALVAVPTLVSMEPRFRVLLVWAGLVYCCGAVGMEAVEAMHRTATGLDRDLIMDLLVMVEETLEMLGLIFLTYTLVSLITANRKIDHSIEKSPKLSVVA